MRLRGARPKRSTVAAVKLQPRTRSFRRNSAQRKVVVRRMYQETDGQPPIERRGSGSARRRGNGSVRLQPDPEEQWKTSKSSLETGCFIARVPAGRCDLRGGNDRLHAERLPCRAAARGRCLEREPGTPIPDYGVPSGSRKTSSRTLSNPKGEPRTQHARTPHHLLNGTFTPNGLHFVISHAGDARHRSGQAPPGDPRPGEAAAGLHARCARALSDGVAHGVRRMRRQQRAAVLERADAGHRAGAARPRLLRRVDRRACSPPCSRKPASIRRRNGSSPKARTRRALSRSVPVAKALDDAMIALYQNGERLMPGNGYPMRLLLPGWEGNMNVKWLRRIKLTEQPAMSYYEARTYAPILPDGKAYQFYFLQEVKSFITHPSPGLTLKRPGLLRDLRHRLFGQRPDRKGDGLRRRRQELGAGGVAGAGAAARRSRGSACPGAGTAGRRFCKAARGTRPATCSRRAPSSSRSAARRKRRSHRRRVPEPALQRPHELGDRARPAR